MTKIQDELEDLMQNCPIPDHVPNDMYVTKEFAWYFKARQALMEARAEEIKNGIY